MAFDYSKQIVLNTAIAQKLTPQKLWDLAIEYMGWSNNNPIRKEEVVRSGKACGEIIYLDVPRVTCWEGFCRWVLLKKGIFGLDKIKGQERYRDIIKDIDHLFYAELIDYASADIINPVLIAKQLGLTDKKQIEVTMEQPLFGKITQTETN